MSQIKIAARKAMHDAKSTVKETYQAKRAQIENQFGKMCRPVNEKFTDAKKKLEVEYHLKLDPLKEKHVKDLEPARLWREKQNELAEADWKKAIDEININYRATRNKKK